MTRVVTLFFRIAVRPRRTSQLFNRYAAAYRNPKRIRSRNIHVARLHAKICQISTHRNISEFQEKAFIIIMRKPDQVKIWQI